MAEEIKVMPVRLAPPNPHYEGVWRWSLDAGCGELRLAMPGGKIGKQDAEDTIESLELVIRQLKRWAAEDAQTQEPPQ